MRRAAVLALCLACTHAASAAVLTHGGYLLGNNDLPLTHPGASMTFVLWNDATAGSVVWSSPTCALPVAAGYYSTVLGETCGSNLTNANLEGAVWLEITIGGVTLTPRLRVQASGGTPFTPGDGLVLTNSTLSVDASRVLTLSETAPTSAQAGSVRLSGSLQAGTVIVGGTTLDEATLVRLANLVGPPQLYAPATASNAFPQTRLQWTGAGAPFLVEVDTNSNFTNPYTATTLDGSVALIDVRRAGSRLPLGTYSWRVKAGGLGSTTTSAVRTFSYVPGGPSCRAIYDAVNTAPNGVYWLDPDGGDFANAVQVYCDMQTAPGGWTLVFSSQTVYGAADRGGPVDALLQSLQPSGSMLSVWTPFVSVSQTRFACDGGKTGVLSLDVRDNAGQIYAAIKADTDGLGVPQTLFNDGLHKLNLSDDISSDADFLVYSGTIPGDWGTYDEYPYPLADRKDFCAGVSYRTRTAGPSVASTSGAYFYVFVR